MIAFVSVLLKEEQARAAEPGLCFTEQYNAQVCLAVVPEAFLLADHTITTVASYGKQLLYVTEKECKLIT